MNYFNLILLMLFFASTSCMRHQSQSITQAALTATEAIGCTNLQSKVFDSMYEFIETENTSPDLEELSKSINTKIDELTKNQKSNKSLKVQNLKQKFTSVLELLAEKSKADKNPKDHLRALIELEMQDQSTDINIKMNDQLSQNMKELKLIISELDIPCTQNETTENEVVFDKLNPVNRMVAGLNNVFTTAYQSCAAAQVPAISSSTPNVAGITRLAQNHPDGIGGKRVISSLSEVQQTHPYIREAGAITSASCFNVKNNPLIYDYGGEPSVLNNSINYFKNAGSGTSVLGVDCSALISSAAAVGGLRYKPGLENKAIFIRQYSQKFINAKTSGFTCYDNITLSSTSTIRPGDIAAVQGHVVIIDKVGTDPFGIKTISSLNSCNQISTLNFDFTVAQSSPNKNGIGINKFIAKDYLKESPKMTTLFKSMAVAACKSYFSGVSSKPLSTEWGIIRHKGTAECLAPKIQMTGQSCVSQCQM